MDVVSLASEFPNDNPALHRGVIWVCTEPTGGARAERAVEPHDPPRDEAETVTAAPTETPAHDSLAPPEDDEFDEAAGPIVVEELEPIEASVEGGGAMRVALASETATDVEVLVEASAPMPAASDVVLVRSEPNVDVEVEAAPTVALAAGVEPVTIANAPPAPAQSEVVLAGSWVEPPEERDDAPDVPSEDASGVPSIAPVFEEVVATEIPRETTSLPPAPDDPFTVLVCTLADVAIGAGSPNVASLLPGLLFDGRLPEPLDLGAAEALRAAGIWDGNAVAPAFVAVTAAWRAILRGTSDDFDACGAAMLDEWASDLLARLLDAPARAPMLRQELRSRGIAAFGLAA